MRPAAAVPRAAPASTGLVLLLPLLLLLLVATARGIRRLPEEATVGEGRMNYIVIGEAGRSSGNAGAAVLCRSRQGRQYYCSGSSRSSSRELLSAEEEESGDAAGEHTMVDHQHKKAAAAAAVPTDQIGYPDPTDDMSAMDYSSAARKPPIHNR